MPKGPHPVEARDQAIIDEAAIWTAFVQVAPGDRRTVETATRAEAEAHARAFAAALNRPAMVYAVSGSGRSALASVIRPSRGTIDMPTETAGPMGRMSPEETCVAKAPRAAKATKAPKAAAPKASKPLSARAQIAADAAKGKLPPAPDFSAETHKRFRSKLTEVIALAKAGDIAGLKAFTINPVSSSPKAIDKYRNLAVTALEARAARG